MINYANEDSTMVILGIPKAKESSYDKIPASESRVGGYPIWHDTRYAESIISSIRCGCCNRHEDMIFLGQVFAPTDTDERSLYIFACNTRSCSLASSGWVVIRNQVLSPEEDEADGVDDADDDVKVKEKCQIDKVATSSNSETHDKVEKSTVWNFLDDKHKDKEDDAEEDEDLSDLLGMLSARDTSLQTSPSSSIPASSHMNNKADDHHKPKHWPLREARPCYALSDMDDPYMEIDKITPDDEDHDDDDEDDDDDDYEDEHIAHLLSEYMSAEEDNSVVEMLKNMQAHKAVTTKSKHKTPSKPSSSSSTTAKPASSSSSKQAPNEDDDEEDMKLDRQLAREDPRSKAELSFQHIVSYVSRQVLRYAYCGKPLWCTAPAPDVSIIPACELCGQPRVFELQLMPALLSLWSKSTHTQQHIAKKQDDDASAPIQQQPTPSQLSNFLSTIDDGFDYGVVAIYCCPDGCCPVRDEVKCKIPSTESGCYVDEVGVTWRECVIVQKPSDIG